jgi:hypothetical protein
MLAGDEHLVLKPFKPLQLNLIFVSKERKSVPTNIRLGLGGDKPKCFTLSFHLSSAVAGMAKMLLSTLDPTNIRLG